MLIRALHHKTNHTKNDFVLGDFVVGDSVPNTFRIYFLENLDQSRFIEKLSLKNVTLSSLYMTLGYHITIC